MKNKLPFYGLFVSLGLILSYIEGLIPFFSGIPGIKLGLCNVLVVFIMYVDSPRAALFINILRIIIAGLLFGNPFSILYSLSGALLSFIVMYILFFTDLFKVASISIMGGIFHNIGQIALAMLIMENVYLFWYIPPLIMAGALTGLLTGIVAQEMIIRLGRILNVRLS